MSLDRQKILNELGSVMNQLQSADCGCMGKLFSGSNQDQGGAMMGSPLPTCGGCRRGCCHGHGYNYSSPSAGEPYSMNNPMNQHCMGSCNPPKLYADTYNYLNGNLMQPVVQEVYNDLKSITPANTIMNSPLAGQMSSNADNFSGNAYNMGQSNSMAPGSMNNIPNMVSTPASGGPAMSSMLPEQVSPAMKGTSGLGPQIVNMIMGDGTKQSQKLPGQGSPLTGPMTIDAPQSPHGQVGVTPLNIPSGANRGQLGGTNHGQYGDVNHWQSKNMNQGQFSNMYQGQFSDNNHNLKQGQFGQGNQSQLGNSNQFQSSNINHTGTMNSGQINPLSAESQNSISHHLAQPSNYFGTNNSTARTQGNMQNNMPGSMNSSFNPQHSNSLLYGQHSQGIAKFNEMFPGVMQGGDLGFDPMAIAIQMNPANKQKATMDTIQKLMTNNNFNRAKDSTALSNPIEGTRPAAAASISQSPHIQQSPPLAVSQNTYQQNVTSNDNINQPIQQQLTAPSGGAIPTQQVYTANYNEVPNQQHLPKYQDQTPGTQQQFQHSSPTTPTESNVNELNSQSPQDAPQSAPVTPQIKEPIFPADPSRNRYVAHSVPQKQYNTLGQPVEMLPAQLYHPATPPLPQTLSPQPAQSKMRTDFKKYSNVKATVSKTSIMGYKPTGKTPSRSQLQNIYNQYKGSQSFTQQPTRQTQPPQVSTISEGKLNIGRPNENHVQQVPIERVGGDTLANNQNIEQVKENEANRVQQMGDVPAEHLKNSKPEPPRYAKCRNGLQDVVYTSYPSSAAWSFHGTNDHRPFSIGYRYRKL